MSHIVAVTGGIGSGKSVVCRLLEAMGVRVYDSDLRARALMDASEEIHRGLRRDIHPLSVDAAGVIDRKLIGSIVFSDAAALERLNALVHGAVRRDFACWAERHAAEPVLALETAILYPSGMDALVDEVWEVEAPRSLRLQRVMARNGVSEAEAEARVASQEAYRPQKLHPCVHRLMNDGVHPVLPRVEELLRQAAREALL